MAQNNLNRKLIYICLIVSVFSATNSFSQTKGVVTDSITKEPISFVNIWVKNKFIGTTTDSNGNFKIENVSSNDTLIISYLGYKPIELLAKKTINIELSSEIENLEEIVIQRMKGEKEVSIKSFERAKKNRPLFFASKSFQYSIGRFFNFSKEYFDTPFIKEVSFITSNSLKKNVPISLSIVKAGRNQEPTNSYILKNHIVSVPRGLKETIVDLSKERIVLPEAGFFVIIDRLYLFDNKLFNKNYKKNKELVEYTYQPAIGMDNSDTAENLWWYYGGSWKSYETLRKKFDFDLKNVAINIVLTN